MGIRTVVIAMALVAAALAVGCSSILGPPKCDADSCTGCCADDHTCVAGTTKMQCGGDGKMCAACTVENSICFMHKCSGNNDGGTDGGGGSGGGGGGPDGGLQLPCGGTCNGCCVDDLCYQGNDTTNCGSGGNVCGGCAGGQSCATKVCVDSSCAGCVGGSTCHTSPNDSHCGTAGTSCYDCTSFGATCTLATGVCTGGTCAGCIDSQGHCQSGVTKGFCGLGGGACTACGPGTGCNDGGTCVMVGNGMTYPGDSCSNPEAVVLNMPLMGSTVSYSNDTMGTCGGTGPDHVYSFSLPSPASALMITVAPAGAAYTPVVFLRGACDSMQLGCSGAAGGGSPAALTVPDAGAGSYFIWVDGLGGSSGNYTLNVTAQ